MTNRLAALRDTVQSSPVTSKIRSVLARPRLGPALRAVGGLVLVVVVLRVVFAGNPPPDGVIVYGAIIGLLYALIAFGLILVYRATRIINFAQAEIGAAAGVLAVLLIKVSHVPYLVALVIALLAGSLSGLIVETTVVRRFAKAPRLVLSVGTIGVALVFAAIQLLLPFLFGAGGKRGQIDAGVQSGPVKTPFSGFSFHVFPLTFDANTIVIVVAAALVLVGLTAFFKLTDIGLAVRAAAENSDRAVLLGINVARVSGVVWLLAGALSALGLFLRIPITGVPVGSFIGPSILLYALAAAVIAKMEKFGTALVAAVALGITEQAVYFSTRDPSVGVALTLPVLLVAMLVQRRSLSRGQDTGVATWQLAKEHRLTPPELRHLPEVRFGSRALGALTLCAMVALPFLIGPTQKILASVVLCYGIVAVSLVILTGWSGQISLGQWAFAGLGAAVAGGVATHLSGDFFVALALAGVAGAVVAVLIGLPALRIQGLYLAVTTLSFALAVQTWLLSPRYFKWLLPPQGTFVERPVLWRRFDLASPVPYYFVCLIFLLLALLSARALRQSRAGRLLIAVRDNQRAAQAYGVSVRRARLWAFAISGFWAALAGALFVYHQGAIDSGSFAPDLSLTLLIVVVIGGSTSLPGAMIGTAYLGFLKYSNLNPGLQLLGTGAGSLLLLWLLPGGLAQLFYGARDVLLRAIARRRDIVVPSLLADSREPTDAAPAQAELKAPTTRHLGGIVLRQGRLAAEAAVTD